MGIDLSNFKVVYGSKVVRALALMEVEFGKDTEPTDMLKKPKFIEILVINEDGHIEALRDEAWLFQFLPVVQQ